MTESCTPLEACRTPEYRPLLDADPYRLRPEAYCLAGKLTVHVVVEHDVDDSLDDAIRVWLVNLRTGHLDSAST